MPSAGSTVKGASGTEVSSIGEPYERAKSF